MLDMTIDATADPATINTSRCSSVASKIWQLMPDRCGNAGGLPAEPITHATPSSEASGLRNDVAAVIEAKAVDANEHTVKTTRPAKTTARGKTQSTKVS